MFFWTVNENERKNNIVTVEYIAHTLFWNHNDNDQMKYMTNNKEQ
jgi:hypothetical protein